MSVLGSAISRNCPLKAVYELAGWCWFDAFEVLLKFTKQLAMVGAFLNQALLVVSVELKLNHLLWHIDFRSVVRKSKCRLLNNPFEGPVTIFMPGYASSVGIFSGDSLTSGLLPYILPASDL